MVVAAVFGSFAVVPELDSQYTEPVAVHRQSRWTAGERHFVAADLAVDWKTTIGRTEGDLGGYYSLHQERYLNLNTL